MGINLGLMLKERSAVSRFDLSESLYQSRREGRKAASSAQLTRDPVSRKLLLKFPDGGLFPARKTFNSGIRKGQSVPVNLVSGSSIGWVDAKNR